MTLQIAAVATDGIVIASDMKKGLLVPYSNAPMTSSLVSKIFRNRERPTVAAWSGSDPSLHFARWVAETPGVDLIDRRALEHQADAVFEEESNRLGIDQMNGEVLIVDGKDLNKIWHVRVQRRSQCEGSISKAIAGHTTNSALYLAERFYEKLPMKRLIPLLACTILEGGRINSFGIEGLEIVTCSKSGIGVLSSEEIDSLKLVYKEFTEKIERHLKPMVAD